MKGNVELPKSITMTDPECINRSKPVALHMYEKRNPYDFLSLHCLKKGLIFMIFMRNVFIIGLPILTFKNVSVWPCKKTSLA